VLFRSVLKDYAEAYVWFSVSVAFENKTAKKALNITANKLTPSAKQAAESRASELYKKIKKNMVSSL